MSKFKTPQEEFWAGKFGDEYIERNKSDQYLASNIKLFSKILEKTRGVRTVIELGANIGMNIFAMRALLPGAQFAAVEINHKAAQSMLQTGYIDVHEVSILDFRPNEGWDLALIKGVLIHLNPGELDEAYRCLYEASRKYICIAEYYSPTPEAVIYRGHEGRLFKRDFAGEMLEKYGDLELVDYGFVYRRDHNFPQDDITWFLLRKN